jgi:hypothetical protein
MTLSNFSFAQKAESKIIYYYAWEAAITNNTNKSLIINNTYIAFDQMQWKQGTATFPMILKEPDKPSVSYDSQNLTSILEQQPVMLATDYSRYGPTAFSYSNYVANSQGLGASGKFLSFNSLEEETPRWNFDYKYYVPLTEKVDINVQGTQINPSNGRVEAADPNQAGPVRYEMHGYQPLENELFNNNEGVSISYSLKLKGVVEYDPRTDYIISVNGEPRGGTTDVISLAGTTWLVEFNWEKFAEYKPIHFKMFFYEDGTSEVPKKFVNYTFHWKRNSGVYWIQNGANFTIQGGNLSTESGEYYTAEISGRIEGETIVDGLAANSIGSIGHWTAKLLEDD